MRYQIEVVPGNHRLMVFKITDEKTGCTVHREVALTDQQVRKGSSYVQWQTELWGHLKTAVLNSPLAKMAADWPEVLMIASWPEPEENEGWESQTIDEFELVQDLVRAIRNLRAEKNVKPGTRIPAIFVAGEKTAIIQAQTAAIASLGKLDETQVSIHPSLAQNPKGHVALVVGSVEIHLPLTGMIDIAEERTRMEKELAEAENQIARLEKLLNSPFAEKAPDKVVQGERNRLAEFRDTAEKLKNQLAELG